MKSKHDKYRRASARASSTWRRSAWMRTASASYQCGDGLDVVFIHPDAMRDFDARWSEYKATLMSNFTEAHSG